jgi:hypothetical protein
METIYEESFVIIKLTECPFLMLEILREANFFQLAENGISAYSPERKGLRVFQLTEKYFS